MGKVEDILLYLLTNHPKPKEISKMRLIHLLFLVDWKSCLLFQKPITSLVWVSSLFGPYPVVINYIKKKHFLNIVADILLTSDFHNNFDFLTQDEKRVIDYVIDETKDLDIKEFIHLIFSTYPLIAKSKNYELDLVGLAKEYKKMDYLFNNR